MNDAIAIVGMACSYPDAGSPAELWENVLAQRRAFRRIPEQRLRLADYFSADRNTPDHIYASEGCFIEGYEFDRVRFRVAGSVFRSADLAHWLALDVAARALDDASFAEGEGLPKETSGVFVGNTLTGEFSRSNTLRLRWPYARRVLEAGLGEQGWPADRQRLLLERCEELFKAPFPEIGEDTLAGNLSNTIAGRICNYFDLKGGGYTVDGACASSLLAASTACSALVAGDVDLALAGGVDLSMDPFELVGFSKAGALATAQMRVYDVHSSGFLPGEGCGFVVLMRLKDAVARGRRIYAVVRGWGVSSDGSGGMTRPEAEGQMLALDRAYRRAGFGVETVRYFEGHGTGTSIGDAAEIRSLSQARTRAGACGPAAAIGSVKANIGHTKAAAGMAGLLKAVLAIRTQILPPTTGCDHPLGELTTPEATLTVLRKGRIWPADEPLRAGVSAMGFGGINTHLVLEGTDEKRRGSLTGEELTLLSSGQDAELFLFSSDSADDLLKQTNHLLKFASRISLSEMGDLAARLARELEDKGDYPRRVIRAAIVAATPPELAAALRLLKSSLIENACSRMDVNAGLFLEVASSARIGFLFPGQASPVYSDGGIFSRRFDIVEQLYSEAHLPSGDSGQTEVAQPAIVTASMAGLRLMDTFGIKADVAVGHSLGEITALHWAGAFDERTALGIASTRAAAMNDTGGPEGAMASIGASRREVQSLLNGDPVVIACLNSPRQVVVSGASAAVVRFVDRVRAKGIAATLLPVSKAFHSPLLASAGPILAEYLSREKFLPVDKRVVSTVTGGPLSPSVDLRRLLNEQLVAPVRFQEAISAASKDVDLFIEVGPGRLLSGLVAEFVDKPVVAIDSGGESLKDLLKAIGAAYTMGARVNHQALFAGRFTRPFDLDWKPRFFTNPCELAPVTDQGSKTEETRESDTHDTAIAASDEPAGQRAEMAPANVFELVRNLVAARVELPASTIKEDARLLADLHLNSITVSQMVAEAARHLGLVAPAAPTDYSNVRLIDMAQALEEMARTGTTYRKANLPPAGIDYWTRCFTIEMVEQPLGRQEMRRGESDWQVLAASDHPLRVALEQRFAASPGSGVIVALRPEADERSIALLLEGARSAIARKDGACFVLVQHGRGAASFARTLHLEAPWVTTRVVTLPFDHPKAVDWIVDEIAADSRFVEADYDPAGRRRVPVPRLLPDVEESSVKLLDCNDVMFVTGGGKGIAAECALSLARQTGARLAIMGRSQPGLDAELGANLERLKQFGIEFRYFAADVTDAASVQKAVREAESAFGPVTAILHGAGANKARLIESLDEESFEETLAPKVQGARNLLASIEPKTLRLFITFGSLIARTGMRGEGDYALANEWLTHLTEEWSIEHPYCRCLAVEWSVWSGVGMGERLGRIDALTQQGITPVPPDEGVSILSRLLARKECPASVVVTGRFGRSPTFRMEHPDLPLHRFLESPRIYYPGVELVVDSEISVETDPYVDDHVFKGERLFPAVMGLEAMAQAAMALLETTGMPMFEEVSFNRAIVIPAGERSVLRVAALVRGSNIVEVVIRSDQTQFLVDHVRAVCRFGQAGDRVPTISDAPIDAPPLLSIEPERDLYSGLLFHKGRFRRLRGYYKIASTECAAEIDECRMDWFGSYLGSHLELGDPGRRDASIHAIQVCVPDATLLPVSVERLRIFQTAAGTGCIATARERSREGDLFTYDLEVRASDGSLLEIWEGLSLQIIQGSEFRGRWVEPLLAPYLERFIRGSSQRQDVSIAIERDAGEPRTRSDRAIQRALGEPAQVVRRPDGRPEASVNKTVSASHCGEITLAMAGEDEIACDVERVVARSVQLWRDLLGDERFGLAEVVAGLSSEDVNVAATRVWSASECLKKAGIPFNAPLVLASRKADGWISLSCGRVVIHTFNAWVRDSTESLIFALLLRTRPAQPAGEGPPETLFPTGTSVSATSPGVR